MNTLNCDLCNAYFQGEYFQFQKHQQNDLVVCSECTATILNIYLKDYEVRSSLHKI